MINEVLKIFESVGFKCSKPTAIKYGLQYGFLNKKADGFHFEFIREKFNDFIKSLKIPENYIPVQEAIKKYNISRGRIVYANLSGILRTIKILNKIFVNENDIKNLIEYKYKIKILKKEK